jgi:hypothetical protein
MLLVCLGLLPPAAHSLPQEKLLAARNLRVVLDRQNPVIVSVTYYCRVVVVGYYKISLDIWQALFRTMLFWWWIQQGGTVQYTDAKKLRPLGGADQDYEFLFVVMWWVREWGKLRRDGSGCVPLLGLECMSNGSLDLKQIRGKAHGEYLHASSTKNILLAGWQVESQG